MKKHSKNVLILFFSTDPKKFGLGLTIVKGIVETHNGYIEIKSKKDSGTTVNIYFPSVT